MRACPILLASLVVLAGCGDDIVVGEMPVLYRHEFRLAAASVRSEEGHPHQGFQQVWVNETGATVGRKGELFYPPGSKWILEVRQLEGNSLRSYPGPVEQYFVMTRLDPEEEGYPEATSGWVYEVFPAPEGDPGERLLSPRPLPNPVQSCHACHSRAEARGYVYSLIDRP